MSGGLPHSEILGSKPILGSPKLIAEYHVLHRLLLPRHPPNALFALDLIQKKPGLRAARDAEAGNNLPLILDQKHTFPLLPMSVGRNMVRSFDRTWLVYLTWNNTVFSTCIPSGQARKHSARGSPRPEGLGTVSRLSATSDSQRCCICISLYDVKVRPIGRRRARRRLAI